MKVKLFTINVDDLERKLVRLEKGKPGHATRDEIRQRIEILIQSYFADLGSAYDIISDLGKKHDKKKFIQKLRELRKEYEY